MNPVDRQARTERMLAASGDGVHAETLRCWARIPHRSGTRAVASQSRCGNHRLESRMRENRTYGSEGGESFGSSRPLLG